MRCPDCGGYGAVMRRAMMPRGTKECPTCHGTGKATQAALLQKAVRLAKENPDAEIHVLADSEELLYGEYQWTGHLIARVELGYWHVHGGDKIFTDPYDLAEELAEMEEREVSEEGATAMMKRAILIYTAAG